jgi:hypothetical protein
MQVSLTLILPLVSLFRFLLVFVTGRLTFHPPDTVVYANEQYVGAAIRESGLARQDMWVTSKYNGGDALDSAHTSLREVCRGLHPSLPPF